MQRVEWTKRGGASRVAVAILVAAVGLYGCGASETEDGGSTQSDTRTSPIASPGDTTSPSTPAGLTGNAVSPSQINLNWSASRDNDAVEGYRVYRNGVLLATVKNATSYQSTGLAASTTYSFTVLAFDNSGNVSGQSPAVIITTPGTVDTTPPSPPTGVSATAVSASRIDLSWSAATDNVAVTGYRIVRNGVPLITVGNVTTFHDTGVLGGTTYIYTIQALDASGNVSGPSPTASATTVLDTTAPTTPTALVANPLSTTQIGLTWSASSDNVAVASYRVYRNGSLLSTLGNVTSYQDSSLTPSTTYTYNVIAVDAASNASGLSAPASATTLASPDTTPPSTPTGVTASAVSTSQIDLDWSASTDNVAIAGYRVFRNGVLVNSVGNVTSYQDTGLAPSTTYTYRVRAIDAAGNVSGQSGAATATTLAVVDITPPSTPTGLAASAVSATRIDLSWIASTDNTGVVGYRVYRNGVFLVALGNVTAYQNTGLAAATTYNYSVDAVDGAGNASSISISAAATTLSPNTATLSWDAVIHPNLAGYRIYYGTAPGTYLQPVGSGVNVGNVVTFTVTGLTSGTRYYFAATAYDTSGNESVFSNEVFKDVP